MPWQWAHKTISQSIVVKQISRITVQHGPWAGFPRVGLGSERVLARLGQAIQRWSFGPRGKGKVRVGFAVRRIAQIRISYSGPMHHRLSIHPTGDLVFDIDMVIRQSQIRIEDYGIKDYNHANRGAETAHLEIAAWHRSCQSHLRLFIPSYISTIMMTWG